MQCKPPSRKASESLGLLPAWCFHGCCRAWTALAPCSSAEQWKTQDSDCPLEASSSCPEFCYSPKTLWLQHGSQYAGVKLYYFLPCCSIPGPNHFEGLHSCSKLDRIKILACCSSLWNGIRSPHPWLIQQHTTTSIFMEANRNEPGFLTGLVSR